MTNGNALLHSSLVEVVAVLFCSSLRWLADAGGSAVGELLEPTHSSLGDRFKRPKRLLLVNFIAGILSELAGSQFCRAKHAAAGPKEERRWVFRRRPRLKAPQSHESVSLIAVGWMSARGTVPAELEPDESSAPLKTRDFFWQIISVTFWS